LGEGEKKEAGVNFLPLLRAPGVVVVVRAFVGLQVVVARVLVTVVLSVVVTVVVLCLRLWV
jgi:hypothetical protein